MESRNPATLIAVLNFVVNKALLMVLLYCQRGTIIFIPVLQRGKIRHRKLSILPKVTQVVNVKAILIFGIFSLGGAGVHV